LGNGFGYVTILKSVHPEKNIRDVCTDSVTELNKLSIEIKSDILLDTFIKKIIHYVSLIFKE
jgi:hypothetical protein